MQWLVSMLDSELLYISHELTDTEIIIQVKSNQNHATCPYCGTNSTKVHSQYEREFHDLSIQGLQTKICLHNKKFFCVNPACPKRTFAQRFAFIADKAKKTTRVQEEILKVAMEMSSISAANYLRNHGIEVSKSVICELVKKNSFDKL
jgi:hypothetical protein